MPPLDFEGARQAEDKLSHEQLLAEQARDEFKKREAERLRPALEALGREAADELRRQGVPLRDVLGRQGWSLPDGHVPFDLFVSANGKLSTLLPDSYPGDVGMRLEPEAMPSLARSAEGDAGWWVENGIVYAKWSDYKGSELGTDEYEASMDDSLRGMILRRIEDHRNGLDWHYILNRKAQSPSKRPWWFRSNQ